MFIYVINLYKKLISSATKKSSGQSPGVFRSGPGLMLPSWVLAVVYLLVAVLLATCLALVGLYGSTFSHSVLLMWLTSILSAFFTSVLVLEPLTVSVEMLAMLNVYKMVHFSDQVLLYCKRFILSMSCSFVLPFYRFVLGPYILPLW